MTNYVSEEWGEVYPIGLRAFETERVSPISAKVSLPFFSPESATVEKSPKSNVQSIAASQTSLALVKLQQHPHLQTIQTETNECTAIAPKIWHQRVIEHESQAEPEYAAPTTMRPVLRFIRPVVFAAVASLATYSAFQLTAVFYTTPPFKEDSVSTLEWLNSTRARYIEMSSSKNSNISAQMYLDDKKQNYLLLLKNLPDSAEGHVYQIWYYTKDSNFVNALAFKGNQGSATLRATIPANISQKIDRVFVSLEPNSGAKVPEGPILLRGKV